MSGPLDLIDFSRPPWRRTPAEWIDGAIPVFAPRSSAERRADPYDRDSAVADIYTGLSYGHLVFGEGAAEGLYRTLAAMLLAEPEPARILDAGAGVGRLVWECAPARPRSGFWAIDLAYENCRRAHAILRGGQPVPLPTWAHRGRPGVVFSAARQLPNACVAQASVLDLPFENHAFDLVSCALVLCRVREPLRALGELSRVLRPGGRLLLATPFGFRLEHEWREAGPAPLRAALGAFGFHIDEWFDGLSYREVVDAHGNVAEWRVTIVRATRDKLA